MRFQWRHGSCENVIPDEDSSLSSLLTSQSKLLENWVQLFLFPLINAAAGHKQNVHEFSKNDDSVFCTKWVPEHNSKNNVAQS